MVQNMLTHGEAMPPAAFMRKLPPELQSPVDPGEISAALHRAGKLAEREAR